MAESALEEVPPEIKALTKLRCLTLSRNKLPYLPPYIGSFSALKTLVLDNNRLTALPEEFALLKKLEILNISFNNFSVLPKYCIHSSLRCVVNARAPHKTCNVSNSASIKIA